MDYTPEMLLTLTRMEAKPPTFVQAMNGPIEPSIEFEFLELNAFGKICGDDCGAEQSRLRSEQRRNIKKERRMVF